MVPNSLSWQHVMDNADLEALHLADLRVDALLEMSEIRQVRFGDAPADAVSRQQSARLLLSGRAWVGQRRIEVLTSSLLRV